MGNELIHCVQQPLMRRFEVDNILFDFVKTSVDLLRKTGNNILQILDSFLYILLCCVISYSLNYTTFRCTNL